MQNLIANYSFLMDILPVIHLVPVAGFSFQNNINTLLFIISTRYIVTHATDSELIEMSTEPYRKDKAKHTNNAQPELLFYYTLKCPDESFAYVYT